MCRPMLHHKNVPSQLHLECKVAVAASLHLNTLGLRIRRAVRRRVLQSLNERSYSVTLHVCRKGSLPEEKCWDSEPISLHKLCAGTVNRSLYTSCVLGTKESGSRPEEECSSSELISQQGLYAKREESRPEEECRSKKGDLCTWTSVVGWVDVKPF